MVFGEGMLLTPSTAKQGIYIMILVIFLLIFNALQSNYLYTMVTDAGVPVLYVGSVYGIASAIGYSTDLWLYTVVGNVMDNVDKALGYNVAWGFGILGGAMMVVIGLLLKRIYAHSNRMFPPSAGDGAEVSGHETIPGAGAIAVGDPGLISGEGAMETTRAGAAEDDPAEDSPVGPAPSKQP